MRVHTHAPKPPLSGVRAREGLRLGATRRSDRLLAAVREALIRPVGGGASALARAFAAAAGSAGWGGALPRERLPALAAALLQQHVPGSGGAEPHQEWWPGAAEELAAWLDAVPTQANSGLAAGDVEVAAREALEAREWGTGLWAACDRVAL